MTLPETSGKIPENSQSDPIAGNPNRTRFAQLSAAQGSFSSWLKGAKVRRWFAVSAVSEPSRSLTFTRLLFEFGV